MSVREQGVVDGGSTEAFQPDQIIAWGLPVVYFGGSIGNIELGGNPALDELALAQAVLARDRSFDVRFRMEPHVYLPPSHGDLIRYPGFEWSWVKGLSPADWWADVGAWTAAGYRIAPRRFSLVGGTDDGTAEWSRQASLSYAATARAPAFYAVVRDDLRELQPTRWIVDVANPDYQRWAIRYGWYTRYAVQGGKPYFVIKTDRLGAPQSRRLRPEDASYREPGMAIRTPWQEPGEWEAAITSYAAALAAAGLRPAVVEHPRAGELPGAWYDRFGLSQHVDFEARPWMAHRESIQRYIATGHV